jgi:O-antigen/teichoic acid export membrane protein
LFHKPAVYLLYGNRFGESADLVAWVGAATISYLVLYAPMTGLRSIQSPSSVLVAYSGAAVTAVAIGSILTPKYGLRGAIVSLCVANLTAWVTAAWLFHHRMRRVLPTRP